MHVAILCTKFAKHGHSKTASMTTVQSGYKKLIVVESLKSAMGLIYNFLAMEMYVQAC